jgi:hypothetical protein
MQCAPTKDSSFIDCVARIHSSSLHTLRFAHLIQGICQFPPERTGKREKGGNPVVLLVKKTQTYLLPDDKAQMQVESPAIV